MEQNLHTGGLLRTGGHCRLDGKQRIYKQTQCWFTIFKTRVPRMQPSLAWRQPALTVLDGLLQAPLLNRRSLEQRLGPGQVPPGVPRAPPISAAGERRSRWRQVAAVVPPTAGPLPQGRVKVVYNRVLRGFCCGTACSTFANLASYKWAHASLAASIRFFLKASTHAAYLRVATPKARKCKLQTSRRLVKDGAKFPKQSPSEISRASHVGRKKSCP